MVIQNFCGNPFEEKTMATRSIEFSIRDVKINEKNQFQNRKYYRYTLLVPLVLEKQW